LRSDEELRWFARDPNTVTGTATARCAGL